MSEVLQDVEAISLATQTVIMTDGTTRPVDMMFNSGGDVTKDFTECVTIIVMDHSTRWLVAEMRNYKTVVIQ